MLCKVSLSAQKGAKKNALLLLYIYIYIYIYAVVYTVQVYVYIYNAVYIILTGAEDVELEDSC